MLKEKKRFACCVAVRLPVFSHCQQVCLSSLQHDLFLLNLPRSNSQPIGLQDFRKPCISNYYVRMLSIYNKEILSMFLTR